MALVFENDKSGLSRYAPLYGGMGEIVYKDFFLTSSNLPIRFQVWTIPVGGSEASHDHPGTENLEEMYYVLEGEAEVEHQGGIMRLGPGDAVLAGPHDRHSLTNVGATPLRVVVIYGKATGPHVPA